MSNSSTSNSASTTQSPQPEPAPAPTGCCPPFDPSTMHEKEVVWTEKPFVKEKVHAIFHVPIDMERKVMKAMRLIDAAHASSAHSLMLGEELSPWRSNLFIEVSGNPVPGAEVVKLSGNFLTRVYEGPFRDAEKWCDDMSRYVAAQGRSLKKIYLGYTTCPACAKAYGKNYVILFAEVVPPL